MRRVIKRLHDAASSRSPACSAYPQMSLCHVPLLAARLQLLVKLAPQLVERALRIAPVAFWVDNRRRCGVEHYRPPGGESAQRPGGGLLMPIRVDQP
jgi:hypothetical protein